MHAVDVLVQSATAYSLALLISAIAMSVPFRDTPTLSAIAVLYYELSAILYFVVVCTFGVQILSKV